MQLSTFSIKLWNPQIRAAHFVYLILSQLLLLKACICVAKFCAPFSSRGLLENKTNLENFDKIIMKTSPSPLNLQLRRNVPEVCLVSA